MNHVQLHSEDVQTSRVKVKIKKSSIKKEQKSVLFNIFYFSLSVRLIAV